MRTFLIILLAGCAAPVAVTPDAGDPQTVCGGGLCNPYDGSGDLWCSRSECSGPAYCQPYRCDGCGGRCVPLTAPQ